MPKTIEQRRADWIAAVNGRSVEQYADMLTEDVVWFPPGLPAVSGRKAFRDWVGPFFDRFEYEFALSETEVREAGDWAIETGTFRSKMAPVGGGQGGEHTGEYLVIWRRDPKSTWQIERYIDTSGLAG